MIRFFLGMLFVIAGAEELSAQGATFQRRCEMIGLLGEFKARTARVTLHFGIEIRLGAEAGRLYLAKEKNVNSKCYEFEILDIDNSAANVPDIIRRASHIKYFVGLGISDQALMARQALNERNAILLSPTATNNLLNKRPSRVITMFPTNSQIAEFLASQALKQNIMKVLTMLDSSSTYSSQIAKDFRTYYEKMGGQIVKELRVIQGKFTDEESLAQIKSFGAEAYFLPLFELDVGKLITTLNRENALKPFLGTDSWGTSSKVILRLTEQIDFKARLPHIYDPNSKSPLNVEFKSLYRQAGGKEDPSDLAAMSFEAVILINRLKERCRENEILHQLDKCLAKALPFPGVMGLVNRVNYLNLIRPLALREISKRP